MSPVQIIARKRDGLALAPAELAAFAQAAANASWPDYQLAALLMAIRIRGLDDSETAALTNAMLRTGAVLGFPEIPLPKIDKHSTGGVGDKVSLVLAPLAAACGLAVPMISGRGLGHTGGTLDKLASIPGFTSDIPPEKFRAQLASVGAVLAGQTADIAPADKKLYALRDVTATVDSLPLICASIMCKKLAEGLDALVLDVKFGRGAFMKTQDDARCLARMMAAAGRAMGKPVRALLTSMHEPLGRSVGNALEVAESINALRGNGPADLMRVTTALASQMLLLANPALPESTALETIANALQSGAALRKFRQIIAAQNGDPETVDNPDKLPRASLIKNLLAQNPDHTRITDVDALGVAQAALALGAGRHRADDSVDPAVGVDRLPKIGEPIPADRVLCRVHANNPARLAEAEALLRAAIRTGTETVAPPPLVAETVA
ncbi:MAG: thymidine phosphorylase [Opitutaceae bacterium]|jgi:pyrimidine-nucleoside phosphorylase|nr:thymidine phosphorylase [Opitutaceae bacterium]